METRKEMTFHVLTLFPQMIMDAACHSILGRAVRSGIIDIHCVDIRDFAINKHKQVDDAPYGGGAGMVMMAQPIYDAYKSLNSQARVIYLSPQGRVLTQPMASELAREPELVLLCGHYEGVDERVIEEIVTDELSIGDYVLTGGEPAALVLIDAVSRLIPGVLGKDASYQEESFSNGSLLEYPQYTRPPEFRGQGVPPVLLSGHHKQIALWRQEQSVLRTQKKRPDLLNHPPCVRKETFMVLDQCKPLEVFKHFEAISMIPRGSGNEKAVSDYIAGFAREMGLEVSQDSYNNLVIRKPGSPGYESHAPLILQAHLDMVCEKNKDTVHDFIHDPLKLRIEDGCVVASGTTLGGDNGIGVAMIMALLDDHDYVHPPLEMLLTADEEAGMSGVENLDAGILKGRRMINLDSSEEGVITTGCAGAARVSFEIPAMWEDVPVGFVFREIRVRGLKGGHSGIEIHNERANSIRILSRILRALDEAADIKIAHLSGGMKINAIPREADAVVALKADEVEKVETLIAEMNARLANEYRVADPELSVTIGIAEEEYSRVLANESSRKAVAAALLLPYGVQAMSCDIPGLVATSANIGVLSLDIDAINIQCMPRSAVNSRMAMVNEQIKTLGEYIGANVSFSNEYPAWSYDPESGLRKAAVVAYIAQYDSEPVVMAVHAGLECGLMGQKIPGLDMISIGPDIWDLHTPDERVSIASVERVWVYILGLLKAL